MSDPTPTTNGGPASPHVNETLSPARRRAEARKAKILNQGGDRLAKITGAMKASSGGVEGVYDATPKLAQPKPPTTTSNTMTMQDDDDPAEIVPSPEASSLPAARSGARRRTTNASTSSGSFEPRFPSGGFSDPSPSTSRASFVDRISGSGDALAIPPSGGDAGASTLQPDDPFAAMMQQMLGGAGGGGGAGANSFLQHMMAAQQGGGPGGAGPQTPPRPQTLLDRIFPLLHLLGVIMLATVAVVYWEPALRSFGSGVAQVEPKGWSQLAERGSDGSWQSLGVGVRAGLAVVPVFWMFVTVELALQAGKLLFARYTVAPPPGFLATIISTLPPPYSTTILTLGKYYSLLSSFLDDLSVLLFAVGCVVMWATWKGRGGGVEEFMSAAIE